jgi:rhamnogalacturonan endolyase
MKFSCPHCGQKINADAEWSGAAIDCPACNQPLVVPAFEEEEEEELPAPPPDPTPPPARAPQRPAIPIQMPAPSARPSFRPAGNGSRYAPAKKSGGGFGKFLLFVLLAAGAAFGYLCYKDHQSPQQELQKLIAMVQAGGASGSGPSATPAQNLGAATPVAKATPTPIPAPTAIAKPISTPPDSVAWIVTHKDRWPKKVTLLKSTVFPGLARGQLAGTVQVPAGAMVDLVQIDGQSAAVTFSGGGKSVPIDATDLRQRATALMAEAAKEAASTPVPVATPLETPIPKVIAQVQPAATPLPIATPVSTPSLLAESNLDTDTNSGAPVTLNSSGESWTLNNGLVRVTISKNGKVQSFIYKGHEVVNPRETWEQLPSGTITRSVTIDPGSNDGERAEVSVKGVNGRIDMEARYTMERGLAGLYAYAIYSHPANYPSGGFGESRYGHQLPSNFDWLSVDKDRNMPMVSDRDIDAGVVVHAKEQRILSTGLYKNSVEHKYDYVSQLYKDPAFGWSSIKDHIGVWLINGSNEYMGGGPTRIDLSCHMGHVILDYWTSGHYAGGAGCGVPSGEAWTKVVGPLLMYCNSLDNPETPTQEDLDTFASTAGNPTIPAAWTANANALFNDALAEAKVIKGQWPFPWVQGVDYPQKSQRATITGRLVLDDPQAASLKLPNLNVGLTHPDYTGLGGAFAERSGNGDLVTWEHDAKYYQFWTEGKDDGTFTITNVRPGTYTLHAYATGVLGNFEQTQITVTAGQNLNLGDLHWKPVRYGKQIWEIGYPDRTGGKFLKGDDADYWLWGWPLRYALLFPNDLTYTIGQSNYHKDWFFEEVPHATNLSFVNPEAPDPANQRFGWVKAESQAQYPNSNEKGPWRVYGQGRATTWTVKFNMDNASQGKATLRIALAGADGAGGLAIGVNGQTVGTIYPVATNALRYNTDRGVWREYTQPFDGALLHEGENKMTFTVPAGDLDSGVVWDYLRLELKDN